MTCPVCNDPSHVEKIREVIEGVTLCWCPECDQYFSAALWWVYGPDVSPLYTHRLFSAASVEACQGAT